MQTCILKSLWKTLPPFCKYLSEGVSHQIENARFPDSVTGCGIFKISQIDVHILWCGQPIECQSSSLALKKYNYMAHSHLSNGIMGPTEEG